MVNLATMFVDKGSKSELHNYVQDKQKDL